MDRQINMVSTYDLFFTLKKLPNIDAGKLNFSLHILLSTNSHLRFRGSCVSGLHYSAGSVRVSHALVKGDIPCHWCDLCLELLLNFHTLVVNLCTTELNIKEYYNLLTYCTYIEELTLRICNRDMFTERYGLDFQITIPRISRYN